MDFYRKCQLFQRAIVSMEATEVRKRWLGKGALASGVREQAPRMRGEMMLAIRDYLIEIGSDDVAMEVADEVCVCEHRFRPGTFAFAMKSALLPTGEDETGDWSRVDDAKAGE